MNIIDLKEKVPGFEQFLQDSNMNDYFIDKKFQAHIFIGYLRAYVKYLAKIQHYDIIDNIMKIINILLESKGEDKYDSNIDETINNLISVSFIWPFSYPHDEAIINRFNGTILKEYKKMLN